MEAFSYTLLVPYWYVILSLSEQSVAHICNIISKYKTLTDLVTALGR
jgi:hypothetical protein